MSKFFAPQQSDSQTESAEGSADVHVPLDLGVTISTSYDTMDADGGTTHHDSTQSIGVDADAGVLLGVGTDMTSDADHLG